MNAQQGGPRGGGGGGAGAGQAMDDRSLVNRVAARSIGPAVMSGRIVDIAVAETPGMRGGRLGTIIYIAAATGGIWKSTSGGVDWEPIFDDAGVGSMGDVTVAPSNANIVWVGTGEPNNQRSSSYGDGVYKSVDAGETFEHMGLRTSQHVGRIVIHPEDPEIVYVAAVGPLWAAGGERGVYRTMDGGESWEAVLTIDQHTGVTDIVMDPTNPDILYAASLQRERRAYSYVGGGPGSGIYKSIDGGDTWTRLTRGLPTSDMGRIGLDISLSHPQTVYAVIEGSEQGVYRTDNGGRAWRRMSDIASIPWYFGQIRVDPQDPEVVYHLGVPLQRSMDGGVTWASAASGGVHVDHHAMWINPEDPTHLLLGNDGGFYVSHNFGDTWDFSPNLPLSQFYAVGIDMQEPFFGIYGGLQDNSTWGGPSATRNSIGVVNADWFRMQGGDGFYAAIDPNDHNIAFVESQNGNLVRFNGRTGERKSIRPRPAPGEDAYRFNWSSPIQLSPFDPATVYFAGNHVFKSPDRGDSWEVLGEDLTREIDRNNLPMMGSIPAANAVSRHQGTAVFSNISEHEHLGAPARPHRHGVGRRHHRGQHRRRRELAQDDQLPRGPRHDVRQQGPLVRARARYALRDLRRTQEQRLPPLRPEEHRLRRELDLDQRRPAAVRQHPRLRGAPREPERALRGDRDPAFRDAGRRRVVGAARERHPAVAGA